MPCVREISIAVLLATLSSGLSAQELEMAPVPAEAPQPSEEQPSSAAGDTPPLDTIPVDTAVSPDVSAEPVQGSRNVLVQEIVVTAQKREENAQDVPVSVAAFSAEQLSALGVQSTKDLSTVTPGLQFSEFAGFTLIYLRGVGTDSFLPYSDPSVASYVDGIYIPAQQGLLNSLGGVERVEVLKGPQGTLFGRNSTGGAINVITKSPSQDFEFASEGEVGNLGTRRAQVYANIPLLDSFALSVSGVTSKVDPYYTLVTDDLGPLDAPPDGPILPEKNHGARVKMRWTPTDALDFTVSAYHLFQTGSGSLVSALRDPSPLATAVGVMPETADYEVHKNEDSVLRVVTDTVSSQAKWSLPWFDLKAIGGYQDLRTKNARYDYDYSAKDLVTFFTRNAFNRVTTGEFQITSNDDSWNADRFKWIGGLYYLHSIGGYDPIGFGVNAVPPLPGIGLIDPAIVGDITAAAQGFLGGIPGVDPVDGAINLNIYGVLETHAKSVFLQGTWDWTDWFATTLGGRYQKEDRFLIDQRVEAVSADGSNEANVFTFNEPKVKQHNFTPKVSLDFRPMDDVLVYLSYTKGYKSGTYNGIAIYTTPSYVEPEEVDAYEVGIKSTFLDGNLRFNAAAFQTETKNLQVTFVSLTNGGAITFENAGEARTRGAEFDAILVPMPETNSGLVLTAGAAYLDSIFTSYENASGYDEDTGLFFNKTGDFTGNRIPRSPKLSGTVGANQLLETAWGPFEIGVDYYMNDGFYYTGQNTQVARQKAYALLNARASWTYEPWNVKLTVFGQNLDDETYSYGAFTADFGTGYTLAPPRTYGLRLNWSFE